MSAELFYFTDPICSACYVFEPQWDQFLKDYGDQFHLQIHMGGLVPDEHSFYDPGNGIFGPEDVGRHWKEMADAFGMPINIDVWKNDPMKSSFPPSIAFKAAEFQDEKKAHLFLKRLRQMVFVEGLNITRIEQLHQAGEEAGLDLAQLDQDCADPQRGPKAFRDDLLLCQTMGVRGFPTLVYQKNGQEGRCRGIVSYDQMVAMINSIK